MNFADDINWRGIINAEEDHHMTEARLDDFENCDHTNGMEFKIRSTRVSYKDFLLWFGISSLEQTEEKSFLLDQRMIQVAEMMQHYKKKIQF